MAQADGADVAVVVAGYERGLLPLAETEPSGRSAIDPSKPGPLTSGLCDDLALLSTKIAPTLSTDQADAWIQVMGTALSDLPGRVAREAARKAIHRPMKFINEVETVIREEAVEITARHANALRRLRAVRDEIERAARAPAPMIEEKPVIWTSEAVEKANSFFRRSGLALRYRLTGTDIEHCEEQDLSEAA